LLAKWPEIRPLYSSMGRLDGMEPQPVPATWVEELRERAAGRDAERDRGDRDPGAPQAAHCRVDRAQHREDGGRAACLRAAGADQPERSLDLRRPPLADGLHQLGERVPVGEVQVQPGGRPRHAAEVLGQQPGLAGPHVHGLEQSVTAQHPEVVGAQDRAVRRHQAPAQHRHPRLDHVSRVPGEVWRTHRAAGRTG
jgi:hypothetical protein